MHALRLQPEPRQGQMESQCQYATAVKIVNVDAVQAEAAMNVPQPVR